MDQLFHYDELLKSYEDMWNYHTPSKSTFHTKEIWDQRAVEWAQELRQDSARRNSADKRVAATVEYLQAHSALKPEDNVIDIGCGSGWFINAFAPYVRQATGADLSPKMLEFGAEVSKERGICNTAWVSCDFHAADIDALGWRERFDLVFTSITPAVNREGLRKIIAMSRGYCFNSCFVRTEDDLLTSLLLNRFDCSPIFSDDAQWRWFYAMVNLLFLWGYLPEITYYKEAKQERLQVNERSANKLSVRAGHILNRDPNDLLQPTLQYLSSIADSDGSVPRTSTYTYGWALWDVRKNR